MFCLYKIIDILKLMIVDEWSDQNTKITRQKKTTTHRDQLRAYNQNGESLDIPLFFFFIVLHLFTFFGLYNCTVYIELSTYCLTNTRATPTFCGQHIWKPVFMYSTHNNHVIVDLHFVEFCFFFFFGFCFVFRAYVLENIYNTRSRWHVEHDFWALSL